MRWNDLYKHGMPSFFIISLSALMNRLSDSFVIAGTYLFVRRRFCLLNHLRRDTYTRSQLARHADGQMQVDLSVSNAGILDPFTISDFLDCLFQGSRLLVFDFERAVMTVSLRFLLMLATQLTSNQMQTRPVRCGDFGETATPTERPAEH